MPKHRSITFTNASEIDAFFKKLGSDGFCDWFNSKIAGRDNWTGKKITDKSNWNKVWSNSSIIMNKASFNLVEFLCINSIIINETGGLFYPTSEIIGSKGHPGISYAFDAIPGTKKSYNTLSKTAYDLFRDPNYKLAHSTKPFGNILKDTNDSRWSGTTFPTGFSGGDIKKEIDKSGKLNTFLTECDFMKFRGRGYIQTTSRGNYKEIIKYVISYKGTDSIINSFKTLWSSYNGDLDKIATISTNQQWDDLFKNTNSIIANYAVWAHSSNGGKYTWIDPNQSDSKLASSIRKVASKIAGANAIKYIDLFYGRIMQQLNLIEGIEIKSNVGATASVTNDNTQTQNEGREERTSEDINNSSSKSQTSSTPGITNKFQPTIKPSEIKFNVPKEKDVQDEILQSLGNFPFIWYNSYQVNVGDIDFFQLFTVDNLPAIKIVFSDTFNLMKDKGFPLDDSKIEVYLNPRSHQLKPILLEFKIVKFSINGSKYNLSGLINVNKLYISAYKSYPKMTSFKAFQEISREMGLGFNTNIDDSSDEMTWINTGQKNIDFMNTIIDSSYKSDDTFLLYYIDFYYNLNYVDLEKELNRDIKQELGVANIGIEYVAKLDDKERVSNLFLTNDYSMKNTNSFFEKYTIINNSTSVSISDGYRTQIKFYDEMSKDLLVFDIDSITSKGNNSIVLKGAPQDETFFNENNSVIYTGKIDKDNMHKNYHYSYVQNNRNISELQKVGIEVEMVTPNYGLYKFQKLFIFVSNQASTPSASHVNNRLTGEWFIIDVVYRFDGSELRQIIKLIRRELGLSPEEIQSELGLSNKKSFSESSHSNNDDIQVNDINNENPVGSTQSSSNELPVDDSQFPLTKEIFRSIYKGKVNSKVVEIYYEPMKNAMIKYGITTRTRIAAFLSQINTETGHLIYTTELSDGIQYEGRKDLDNLQPGDGPRFKGRGLIQLTGRSNYRATGKFLNKDFIGNPQSVSAENDVHRKGAGTAEQVENSILTSIRFWLKGSAWGNLNEYADKIDIKKPMVLGGITISQLPNTNKAGKQYGVKKKKNIATQYSPNDINFTNFTLICFGVNGGYNGFRERVENWNKIREYFK